MKLLEIKNLTTEFKTGQGIVKAVRNVNYSLEKGEILGIVGESGSGKSVGMLSLMGLLADNGRIVSGSIIFDGEEISPISEKYKNNKITADSNPSIFISIFMKSQEKTAASF
mgnify:CR=1 FL=1